MKPTSLFADMFTPLTQALDTYTPRLSVREFGTVTHIGPGIARVIGLPGVRSEELVQFPHGLLGIAYNLDPAEVGVILLGDNEQLAAGDDVTRTGRVADVPVGEALLGRVVDATGRPLDDVQSASQLATIPSWMTSS